MATPRDQQMRRTQEALSAEMNDAFNRYREAHYAFEQLLAITSGAEGADGVALAARIQAAGERQRMALAAYLTTLKVFVDFAARGTVQLSKDPG